MGTVQEVQIEVWDFQIEDLGFLFFISDSCACNENQEPAKASKVPGGANWQGGKIFRVEKNSPIIDAFVLQS